MSSSSAGLDSQRRCVISPQVATHRLHPGCSTCAAEKEQSVLPPQTQPVAGKARWCFDTPPLMFAERILLVVTSVAASR